MKYQVYLLNIKSSSKELFIIIYDCFFRTRMLMNSTANENEMAK